jgi:DNA-binding SARP family transcriptional activator
VSQSVPRATDNGNVLGTVMDDAQAWQAVRVQLLGPFVVTSDGRTASPWPRPSARRLCELVLVSPGRRVSRDLACEELFPGLETRAAARALSKALSMARSALTELGEPAASLLAADLSHIWASAAADVDADAHQQALRDALAMDPGDERDGRLAAALAEDGELLADEPYADWALRPRERLEALRQEARLALARDRAKGAGRSGPDDVIAAWQSCLEHDPACEEAAGALVRIYLATGRPELAARAYERCRAALQELGLRISPSLQKVYAAAAQVPVPARPTAAAAPTAPQAGQMPLREELRTVSVLFAEVAAPLRPAGADGLETLRELVGGCIAAVITEVEALGGTVTSVSGRGLQAMFGAPTAHEDDPERAARAAFRALSADAASADGTASADGAALALRIGVETGPALVGPIGGGAKIEYAAVGDVVSAAAALQASARPGTALIGPATRAVIDHLFTWGGSEVVGSSGGPMTASYLDAPRARAAGRQPRLGRSAPLVGRHAEMAELGRALRGALDGRGSVVVLTGEPGLGKTRLVQECRKLFMAWVGARSGRLPLWLEGRSTSYASATPYGLYQQLVASWVGVAPDQPDEQLRPALERSLTALMGNANLLAPLARMMGLPGAGPDRLGPEELQRVTFDAVRSLLVRLAAVGPTVLVLEDLHWADPTSQRLTGAIAALAARRPLLVLATTRPGADSGVTGSWHRPVGVARQARRILLRPLPEDVMEALAISLIGDTASRQALAAVLDGAAGNPLFLEEQLSSLLETRALVCERGTWQLRGTPASSLPQVLDRLVRSRVDRLSPAAQEAIRAASVLGTDFPQSLLAAVLPDGGALESVIDELCASGLLHEMPGSGEPAFRFRHALIQEATYLGLVREERHGLHGRAARAIESAAAGRLEEVAAVLGRHFAAAQEAERAVCFLEMAGDHATDAFANDEAMSCFQTAVALVSRQDDASLPAGGTTARLHAKLANVLWRTGRRQEAGEAFRAALRVANRADTLLRAHLYTRLGRLDMADDRFDAAAEAFDAAGALLTADPLEMDDATADQWLELMVDGWADLHNHRNEPDRALAALDAARPVLAARGTPAREFAFYSILAAQRLIRNRYRADETDVDTMRKGLDAARRTGEEKDLGYATYFLGWTFWLCGDLARAQEHLERALAMAERIGETLLLDKSLQTLVLTALRRNDVQAVRSLLPRAMAAAEMIGTADHTVGTKACQAWLAWQDRRPDDVIRLAGDNEQIEPGSVGSIGSCARFRWVYLWPLIAVRLAAAATAGAVAAGRQILNPSQQALPDELTAVLQAGCEAWDRGEPTVAADRLSAALALAHQLHYF